MSDSDVFEDSTAGALLDAHVAWIIARLEGPMLQQEYERRLDWVLADAARLRLKDVVQASAVRRTAVGYAAEMKVGGAIPALVGDIAVSIYEHPIHAETTVEDLLPDQRFEELLDKLLEMRALRESLLHHSVANPVFTDLAAQLVYSGLRGYLASSTRLAAKVPGARSAMKVGRAVVDRARSSLGPSLEQGIHSYVNRTMRSRLRASEQHLHAAFESDAFRQAVLDFWDDHKQQSLSSVRDLAGQLDIEELFVIGYEYWQQLRRMPIYRELIENGVDVFFETYRNATLIELLDDIGVTRQMILDDGMRFLPTVIAALKKEKMLEPAIRRQLEGFYRSDDVAEILR